MIWFNPSAQVGILRAGWQNHVWWAFDSPRMETPELLWATCASVWSPLQVNQLVFISKLNFLYFSVCAKSHQVGGFLTRDDHMDCIHSLAACDKLVSKFPIVYWVRDRFQFLFSTLRLCKNPGIGNRAWWGKGVHAGLPFQWWGLQTSRKRKQQELNLTG